MNEKNSSLFLITLGLVVAVGVPAGAISVPATSNATYLPGHIYQETTAPNTPAVDEVVARFADELDVEMTVPTEWLESLRQRHAIYDEDYTDLL